MTANVRGGLPKIIRNDDGLYSGNLVAYFCIIFNHAQNLWHQYHNFRHMLHVTWLCHQACIFYHNFLSQRKMRNLLIAAMFHDFDHSGMAGNDDLNIARATRGFNKYTLPEDFSSAEEITLLIQATEFPRKHESSEHLSLCARILQDADMCQALNEVWLQQTVFGLADEWGKKPIEILSAQEAFLSNLKLQTKWAQAMFPQSQIDDKISEAKELLEILAQGQ